MCVGRYEMSGNTACFIDMEKSLTQSELHIIKCHSLQKTERENREELFSFFLWRRDSAVGEKKAKTMHDIFINFAQALHFA